MVMCYVLGCKSRSERKCENITFHSFPKDSTIRQLWINATGLVQECLKKCIGLNLFSQDHYLRDQPVIDNKHLSLLIKAICKKYLNVRIHYATKSLCNKGENIRDLYTKLILFKGQ